MIAIQLDWRRSSLLDDAEEWCRKEIANPPYAWLARRNNGDLEEDLEKYGWLEAIV